MRESRPGRFLKNPLTIMITSIIIELSKERRFLNEKVLLSCEWLGLSLV